MFVNDSGTSDDAIYTIICVDSRWLVFADDSDDPLADFASDLAAIEWCRRRTGDGAVYTAALAS